jgi:uncharacterized membrane protein
MPELSQRRALDQPRVGRGRFVIDPDGFARISERLARFLGTGRFLAIQSVIVLAWIVVNVVAVSWQWDPYPFILLNLAFSTQAAYAAPLILLAQNRQDDRDRVSLEEDRARAERTKADTEYLARELAALRLALGEMVTRDDLRDEMERLIEHLDDRPTRRGRKARLNADGTPRKRSLNRPADG